jgi:hypothetical protein
MKKETEPTSGVEIELKLPVLLPIDHEGAKPIVLSL